MATEKRKILICENYEALKESFKLILEDDFNLYFADTVEDLFNFLETIKVDLLILDVDRKDMDILALLRDIKQKWLNLKILLVSADFSLKFQEDAIKMGTDIRFLTKVFKPQDVSERVKTIIRGYSETGPHKYIVRIKTNNVKRADEIQR